MLKRRIAMSLFGVIICAIAVGIFKTAALGVSTYDAVAIVLSGKWKLGKFQYVRICCDVVCVVLGITIFLIGGGAWAKIPTVAGIGTVITAFFMGPLIELFNVKVAQPLLQKGQA